MNDFNDELSGIFDHLDPDDFLLYKGNVAFHKFFTQAIDATRFAWMSAEGAINPVAILASPSERWFVPAEDDETLGQYVQRVRDEAKQRGARWVFISRRAEVAQWTVTNAEDLPEDVLSEKAMEDGARLGTTHDGVFYYSEHFKAKDDRTVLHGIMVPDGVYLGEPREGNPKQRIELFERILG